jgi:hypothetical protein
MELAGRYYDRLSAIRPPADSQDVALSATPRRARNG